jgi:hypothetical protein
VCTIFSFITFYQPLPRAHLSYSVQLGCFHSAAGSLFCFVLFLVNMSGRGHATTGVTGSVSLDRLSALQNACKRDPSAYAGDFKLQVAHWASELELLRLAPSAAAAGGGGGGGGGGFIGAGGAGDDFIALTRLLAHCAHVYPVETAPLAPALLSLLGPGSGGDAGGGGGGALGAEKLSPHVRRAAVSALVLLRNRGLVPAPPVHALFFALLRVRDAALRELVRARARAPPPAGAALRGPRRHHSAQRLPSRPVRRSAPPWCTTCARCRRRAARRRWRRAAACRRSCTRPCAGRAWRRRTARC